MVKSRASLHRVFLALLLFAALFAAAAAAAAEDTSGYVRVYGYKDVIERDERKFAPYAVLQDVAHSKEFALRYTYSKADNYTRSWELRLVRAAGHKATSHSCRIDVYLPYPSIWSDDQQAYWKWTKEYASRYDWTVEKVMTVAPYTKTDEGPIEPANGFGFRVSFFDGIPGKRVTIRMAH